jgi:hypothetical protein
MVLLKKEDLIERINKIETKEDAEYIKYHLYLSLKIDNVPAMVYDNNPLCDLLFKNLNFLEVDYSFSGRERVFFNKENCIKVLSQIVEDHTYLL